MSELIRNGTIILDGDSKYINSSCCGSTTPLIVVKVFFNLTTIEADNSG